MNNKYKIGIAILFVILGALLVYAADFVPSGDINGRGIYAIKNFVNVSATNLYGNLNASYVQNSPWITLGQQSNLNVNSSVYWNGINSFSGLNYNVLSYYANITDRPLDLANFTNSPLYVNQTEGDSRYVKYQGANADLNLSEYNLTTSKITYTGTGNYMTANSTCVIIQGATTTMTIC